MSRRPRALLVAAALLAAACARRTRAPGEPPAGSAGPLFAPYPAAEVAGVKSPHDYRGKPLCQRCHRQDGKLLADANGLCRECHRLGHGSHPVEVVQRTPSAGLPLLADGKVACHTCHDPHRARSPLRKPFNELCTTCHAKQHRHG